MHRFFAACSTSCVLALAACGAGVDVDADDALAVPAPPRPTVAVDAAAIDVQALPDPRALEHALKWQVPLAGRLTDRFGPRRDGSFHDAVDVAAPMGADVVAPADLVVRTIAYQTRAGRYLVGDVRREDGSFDGDGYRVTFAHLSHVAVFEGDVVKAGGLLGEVGLSGSASGPHLHLRVEREFSVEGKRDRVAVDPLLIFAETAFGPENAALETALEVDADGASDGVGDASDVDAPTP